MLNIAARSADLQRAGALSKSLTPESHLDEKVRSAKTIERE
jgi:hypothetical protein